MATHLATGQDLVFTLDTVNISPQCASVILATETTTNTVQTLAGPASYGAGEVSTLACSLFQDWGAATSFFATIWDKAGETIAFVLDVEAKWKFTGSVVCPRPPVGGAADAALQSDMVFTVTGVITKAAIP